MSSEDILKWSLFTMHVIAVMLAGAVMMGRDSAIIADMFSASLAAIAANLAIISGNKALQKFADKMVGTTSTKSTIITEKTTEPPTDAPPAS